MAGINLNYFYYVRRYNYLTQPETIQRAEAAGIPLTISSLRKIEQGKTRPRKETLLNWSKVFGIDFATALKAANGDIEITEAQWKKLGVSAFARSKKYGMKRPKFNTKGPCF